MRNGPLFFLGLFVALTISWAGMVLSSQLQLGALAPFYDETESKSFPDPLPGIAARGQLVYADLGCAACHTQAVRRPDFGSDQARGWGDRQSVSRDYIYQTHVQLGASRLGPDLANLASRKPSPLDAEDLMKLLYTGQGAMPPYRFLFEESAIVGEPKANALKTVGNLAPALGYEILPSERARSLVAYLLSLNNPYDYPESRPFVTAASEKKAGAKPVAPAVKPGVVSPPADHDSRLDQAAVTDESLLAAHAKILGPQADEKGRYKLLPLVLVLVFGGLIFVAGTYLNRFSGHFDPRVYDEHALPHTGQELAVKVDPLVLGKKLFNNAACNTCHQATGLGQPGVIPPLAGSEWVVGSEERVVRIVLYGLQGPVKVKDATYSAALMPAFGKVPGSGFNWTDDKIAAVLSYVRQEWGNAAGPITVEQVNAIHAKEGDRKAWTADELQKLP
jgi:cytochrome c oxidase cbb3-type subunit 2